VIDRWLLLGLLGLGGCFAPDAVSSTDDGESTEAAASTTVGMSTEASTEASTDPTTSAEEESTGGGCPDAVFDRTAWDESCFVD
jgi:hypothetical protein